MMKTKSRSMSGPLVGCSGGCIVALSMIGASGMLAAWARPLIAVALASAVAVPRKLRRDSMAFSILLPSRGCLGRDRGTGLYWRCPGPAVHGGLQFRLCEPELALGFDGGPQ